MDLKTLESIIRDVPDFPKPGIVFKDITPLLANAEAFKATIDLMVARYQGSDLTKIVGVESRGFVFGAALAHALNLGLVLVRKPGKLPADTYSVSYALEYGTDTLEVHKDSFEPNDMVLVVDDLLATGGTAAATVELVRKAGGHVKEVAFLIELGFLDGRKKIAAPVHSWLNY